MDRVIAYVDENMLVEDFLNSEKNTMTAIGMALQAILGTATLVDGLACTPTSPASLQVLVAQGSITTFGNIDGTAYGDLGSDTTHQIVKQGIVIGNTTFTITVPSTTGQSQKYLIQAEFQEQDAGSTVLPYYNASNPAVAWNGPNNTGTSQNTVRKGACVLSLKAGTPATTGTQTTPTPDAGFIGLWVINVANGATTITSGNITPYSGITAANGTTAAWSAPFITEKLMDKVSIATGDSRWQSIGGGGGARTRLTNSTTYHVATTGNDTTGDGTGGNPWATIQHAYDFIASGIDLNGFTATIAVADGTYSAGLAAINPVVGGAVALQGNLSTPANCIISSGGAPGIAVYDGCRVSAGGFKVTGTSYLTMARGAGAKLLINGAMEYGSGGGALLAQINAFWGGFVEITHDYTISGGAGQHYYAAAAVIEMGGVTVTLTGTPAYAGEFARATFNGTIQVFGNTYSGSATGNRYLADSNGSIGTNGGGASFLPGSNPGSATNNGTYT